MGSFRLVRKVAEGEVADVMLASLPPNPELVIVKRLREELRHHEDAAQLFTEEIRITRQLAHPSIVRVLDAGDDGGLPYFVMERLEGLTLRAMLDHLLREHSRIHPALACAIAGRVARALGHAHEHGVVHRDITPDNVVLTRIGEVKLIDFGISRIASALRVTRSGLVRGKVNYMAPEQLAGLSVGPPADLFSLGVVLWEMLVGRHPFPGTSTAETTRAIRDDAIAPPSTERRGVPASVDALVMALVAKFPRSRPGAALPVAAFLDAVAVDLGLSSMSTEIAALVAGKVIEP